MPARLSRLLAGNIAVNRARLSHVASCHVMSSSYHYVTCLSRSPSLYFIGSLARDSSGKHTKYVKHDPSVPFDLTDVN